MNSIFGMFMESWKLRVSCKINVYFGLNVNFARDRDPKYSWFYEHSTNWIHFLRTIAGNTSHIKIFHILCIQFVLSMACQFMK